MVHVNTKPQYLVFCLPLQHPVSKYAEFACGKLIWAASRAGLRIPNATKTVQTLELPVVTRSS
jgi:hypothetical protein